jgi:Tol biopolymer transport system component
MLRLQIPASQARLNESIADFRPSISPDGKQLACYYSTDAPQNVIYNFGTIPLDGGQPTKVYGVPLSANFQDQVLQWTPEGRSLAFIDNRSGVRNIWSVPIGGGGPRQLTHFTSDGVFYFAWSRDGKQLALSRGSQNTDAVLISENK